VGSERPKETLAQEREPKQAGFISPIAVALIAVLTALTTAVTMTIAVPFPPTKGYFNLGDAIVFFSALTFGWRAGVIAGGIGSAAADILLGFGFFAPVTLVAKGVEGLVAGAVGKMRGGAQSSRLLAVVAGGICMVAGYFFGETIYYGIGPALAEIPVNIAQVAVGGSIGLALSYITLNILKDFPRIPWRL
jgi:uncharacterized membrane protein